ncbi:glycosyl hydrolase family 6 [Kineococcus xinjiangensis]|uniref:Glucanase n=1 Tax=Kineococcus xinjiangensis TaxID=512762 RepID=A0A2S6IUQ1_9ACTN|nr:glycosyl hydrolase family 6 [Kineococcus xinjiangensis]
MRRLADGIGEADAIVVLEPDAVPHALEGCLEGSHHTAEQRYAALREATGILKRNPATRVYLDAGNAGWIDDLDALAAALRASGLEEADGFALNVSNFKTTESSASYGRALSDRTGGAHFVIDTSRNGAGPAEPDGSGTEWCNPPGRHLGAEPTLATGDPRIDAYLWVKQPGDSDGSCRPGEPTAGAWWPEYALDLVMNTRMGHPYTGHP